MTEVEIFHAGEIALQERTGQRSIAQRRGPMIRDRLVDGARAFVRDQAHAAVAAVATDGTLWASLWCGAPGFLRSDENGEHLEVLDALERTPADDPVRPVVRETTPLAMLVIDFATR